MAEYIEKDKAINAVFEAFADGRSAYITLEALPAADVAPVRHGWWIWDKDGMDWNIGAWRCSECKAMSPMWWNADETSPMNKSGHRYCPNCGAKMEEEEEDGV